MAPSFRIRVLVVLGLILLMGLTTVPSFIPPARAACAPPEPGFIIEADPDSLELLPDASGTSTITVTSIDGFAGSGSITNTPSGPITVDPVSTTIDVTAVVPGTFTLTITVDAAADPGLYSVSVDGVSDLLFDSVLVFVEVPGPDFSIEADPTFLTLGPVTGTGTGTNTSTITVTRKNTVTGIVSLKTVEPTPGPTAVLDSDSVDMSLGESQTVLLTVTSTASTPVGFYTVSIEGTFGVTPDSITHSTTVFVLVKGPDFIMFADPLFLTVIPGGASNSSAITLESILGFAGTVDLTLVPPPPYPGFTVGLDAMTVVVGPGAPATATLTVSAASPFPSFPFLLVHVMGTSTDGKMRFAFVFVEVLIPDIELSASPDSLPLVSGSTSSITVKSLYGFDGPVMLTASSDPCIDSSIPESVTVPVGGSVKTTLTITVDPTTPPGIYDLSVTGTSPSSLFVGDTAFLTVGEDTTPPTWPPGSSLDALAGESSVSLSWDAADDDVGVDIYEILQDGLPVATVFAPTTSHTVTGLSAGTYLFQVVAKDAAGNSTPGPTKAVTIAGPVNDPPSLSAIGNKAVDEGALLTFTASATDPEGDSLTFSLDTGVPSGASISPTGGFTWTPTEAQGPEAYSVTVIVTDNGSPPMSDSETVTITVAEVNTAPVLGAIGDKVVQETTTISFTATASDSDLPAQTLTFSLEAATTGDFPTGATMLSGTFSWTPTAAQGPGVYRARITVSDGSATDFEEITITVSETPVNNPPVLASIGNKPVNEGTLLSFTVTATDPDVGQTVTLSHSVLPPGATFNPATGQFSWTPTEAQGQGTFSITFTVTDNGTPVLSDSETIAITVNEVNQAPVLPSLAARTATQGSQLTFTITASDPDGPIALTFSLEPGAPSGASINPSTGVFSWTPTADQAGTYTITVRVSDGTASDTKTFTVTVSEIQPAAPAPQPFWVEYWYVILIIVLVLVGIPVAMKVRGKPGSKS